MPSGNSQSLPQAALDYAKRGWFIFPVEPKGKFPLAELVPHGVLDATTDPDQIREWYRRYPNANIGVNCGKSKIVGIDVDNKPGQDGFYNWRGLCSKLGIDDTTVTSRTGSGGMHLIFRAPDGIELKSTIGTLGEDIDSRAGNSYLVLPPSIHENGKCYEWELEYGLDFPMAPLPEPLIALMQNGKRPKIAVGADGKVPEGQRNGFLISLAGSMRRRGMSQEGILAALLIENEARCNPPLSENEVKNIAASGARYEPGTPVSESGKIDFELTDLGNAMRLVGQHGDDLRYCHKMEQWLIWNEKQWKPDEDDEIRKFGHDTVTGILRQATDIGDPDERSKRIKKALTFQSTNHISGMLYEAKPLLPVRPEELDRDPFLFNCSNGVIDLRIGELREHQRDDFLSKIAPVEYNPEVRCEKWETFLFDIMEGNDELIRFLQKAVGYSLTGDTSEQCVFFLFGVGDNGKGTFTKTIMTLLGDYSASTPTETLMVKRDGGIPTDIARLPGIRFVAASESDRGRRLSEALIKQLSGEDTIAARHLYANWFEFDPAMKIWLSTNHKPVIRGTDHAIWRRIRLIPFNYVVPDPLKDKNLKSKLATELSGILNWAIEGCLTWQKEGLKPPKEVTEATASYREEMDILGTFLSERCTLNPSGEALFSELYKHYKQWCEETSEKPISSTLFGRLLVERGFRKRKETTGSKRTFYCGLSIGSTVESFLND